MQSGNGWFKHQDSKTTIVMIHGYLSNAKSCWTSKNSKYWPEIIAEDKQINNVNIFLAEYHTSATSKNFDMLQCVRQIKDAITDIDSNQLRVIDSENIIFVCHSLGGILCRRLLAQNMKMFKGKKVGLMLIGSPSLGSEYAKYFSLAISLLNNKVGQQLNPNGETIAIFDSEFRELLSNKELNIEGVELCEHKAPLLLNCIRLPSGPIVKSFSASRYFGAERIMEKTDHMTICKPDNENHPTHKELRRFLNEKFQISPTQNQTNSNTVDKGNPLFDILRPVDRKYYTERNVDKQIKAALECNSIWLYGASGTGKTSAARNAIYSSQENLVYLEVTLSAEVNENFKGERLNAEIIQSIDIDRSTPDPTSKIASALLAKNYKSPIPLLIDEVRLNNTSTHSSFLDAVDQLLSELGSKLTNNPRIIICSINEPSLEHASERLRERITKIPLEHWDDTEIRSLINIARTTSKHHLEENDIENLVIHAQGSPRYIKSFYRVLNQIEVTKGSAAITAAFQKTNSQLFGHQ